MIALKIFIISIIITWKFIYEVRNDKHGELKSEMQHLKFNGWGLRTVDQQISVDRQMRSYIQPYARALVDFVSPGVQLLLAMDAQVRAVGQVLAHYATHVLIRASLPRSVQLIKVHLYAQ